jgi:hypothetical protein
LKMAFRCLQCKAWIWKILIPFYHVKLQTKKLKRDKKKLSEMDTSWNDSLMNLWIGPFYSILSPYLFHSVHLQTLYRIVATPALASLYTGLHNWIIYIACEDMMCKKYTLYMLLWMLRTSPKTKEPGLVSAKIKSAIQKCHRI